jgi:hypothetical protein
MIRQDAIDLFVELNKHEKVPVLVRMKCKSLLDSCQTPDRVQQTENYAQTISTFADFLSLIDDPNIVSVTSIVVPIKKRNNK